MPLRNLPRRAFEKAPGAEVRDVAALRAMLDHVLR